MGQGPESLDRLGTLSLSKRPVEGLTRAATKREARPADERQPYIEPIYGTS